MITMPSSVPSLPAVVMICNGNGNGNDNTMAIATSKGTQRRRCRRWRRRHLHHSIHLWPFLYMLIVITSCIMNNYTSRNCGSSSSSSTVFVGSKNNFFLVAAADNVNENNDNDDVDVDDDDDGDGDGDGDDDEAADGYGDGDGDVAASGDTSGDTKDDDVDDYDGDGDGDGDAFDDRFDLTEDEHEGDYDYGSEEENNDDAVEGDYQEEIEDIFMSSEDVTCMEETWSFFVNNPELEQACDEYAKTIQDQQQNNNNKNLYDTRQEINGIQTIVISYPDETITALEEVCDEYKGYWMSITGSVTSTDNDDTTPLVFTCTIMDTESMKVIVHNYGQCLADVEVCQTVDSAKVLESVFGDMDLACYEGEGLEDKPENFEDITQQVDAEYFEQELNTKADDDGYIDEDFGFDFEEGTMEDVLEEIGEGMSDTEKQCFEDTVKFNQQSETTKAAYLSYSETMTTNLDDDSIALLVDGGSVHDVDATTEEDIVTTPSVVVSLAVGFSEKGVAMLQEVCTANGGYFLFIEEASLSCTPTVTEDHTSTAVPLTVTNVADCLANTDECSTYTSLSGLEHIWTEYGLNCSSTSSSSSSSSTGTSSSTSTLSTSNSSPSSSEKTTTSSSSSSSSSTNTESSSSAATGTETGGSDDGDDAGPGACYDISIHVCNCDVGSCNAELCAASNMIWTVECPNHCTNCNSATAATMANEGHSPSESNSNDISPSSSSTTTTQTSSEDDENSSLTMNNDDTSSTSSFLSGWFGGSNDGGGNGSSSTDGMPVSYLIIGISSIAIMISMGGFILIRQRRNRLLGIGRGGRGGSGRGGGGGGRHAKVEMTDMSHDLDLELT